MYYMDRCSNPENFLSPPKRPDLLWDPPNLLFNGYAEVNHPGREANNLPPFIAEAELVL